MQNKAIKPKISVVMPVHNEEQYLALALDSILNQTFRDFELIIINDASTDSTADICKKYSDHDQRIRVITNRENINIGASLNKGILNSRAEIIARMDGDDICFPDRFALQYEYLQSSPDVSVVGSGIVTVDEHGHENDVRLYSNDSERLKKRIFRYSPFAHPTTMFRKKAVIEAGMYNSEYSPTEDLDLWVRVGVNNNFANIQKPLLKYRVFSGSESNKNIKKVETMAMKIRWNAFRKYGYKPSILDVVYNILQLLTVYLMPTKLRYKMFNFLRNKGLI